MQGVPMCRGGFVGIRCKLLRCWRRRWLEAMRCGRGLVVARGLQCVLGCAVAFSLKLSYRRDYAIAHTNIEERPCLPRQQPRSKQLVQP